MPDDAHDAITFSAALELLTTHGFDGLESCLQMLFIEAMQLERSAFLGAGPYERCSERLGHANGFRSKTVTTRFGELELSVPKTSGLSDGAEPFNPQPSVPT